ncbi:MAG: M43 family zinc metalloprotease [Bacteroidia bacterium]
MKKRLLSMSVAALMLSGVSVYAQKPAKNNQQAVDHSKDHATHRNCGTMEHLDQLRQENPNVDAQMQQEEQRIQNFIQNDYNPAQRVVYTIPVVFHVVYQNATENIGDPALLAQLQVLNDDFRKLNADASLVPSVWQGIAADCEINFCLATTDPQGNPTTGITRTQTSDGSFSTDDQIKYNAQGGKDAWPAASYLNIWVGDLGNSLLGYAQFPNSGPAAEDGVVLHYRYTGTAATGAQAPFDKGRTATHEVGHWLNLFHIWGDDGGACSGSDQVADTPNQANATGGCFNAGTVLTDNCSPNSPGYQWQNYMDYTDDACMYMFTNGQKARVQAVMAGSRSSLANSAGCSSQQVPNDAGIFAIVSPTGTLCNTTFTPIVTLKNFGSANLTAVTINYRIDNNANQTYAWAGNLGTNATVNVTLPSMNTSAGAHTFTAFTTSPNNQTDANAGNDQAAGSFTANANGQNLPLMEGFEGNTFPPVGWTLTNPDAATTWERTTQAAKTGLASAYMDNLNYNANGERDFLMLPGLNLTSVVNPVMTFQVAYQLYTDPNDNPNYSDTLIVQISTDCGVTWTNLYLKYGTQLTTIVPTFSSNEFIPTQSQWRLETVSLTSYSSATNAMFRFINSTQYENQLYVDDINIMNSTDIAVSPLTESINLFPNPTQGNTTLNVTLLNRQDLNIQVVNALGQTVQTISENNTYGGNYMLDLSNAPAGVYFVEVTSGNEKAVKRLVITH